MKINYIKIAFLNMSNVLGFAVIIPVLPFIVEKYIGTSEEKPITYAIYYGLLFSTYAFFQFFATPVLGRLSDKWGRRKVMIISQVGTVINWMIFCLAYFLPEVNFLGAPLPIQVIVFSGVIGGSTGSNISVANAYISDITQPSQKTRIFGFLSAFQWLALIFGPVIGALVSATKWEYFAAGLISLIVAMFSLVLVVFFIQESTTEVTRRKTFSNLGFNIIQNFGNFKDYPGVQKILFIRIFFALVFSGYFSLITLFLMHNFDFEEVEVGLFFFLLAIFSIINDAILARYVEKKVGTLKTFYLGQMILIVSLIVMSAIRHPIFFAVTAYFISLGFSLNMPTFKSYLTNKVDQNRVGEVLGLDESIFAFAAVVAPLIASLLYGTLANWTIFILSIVIFTPHLILSFFTKKVFSLYEKSQNVTSM